MQTATQRARVAVEDAKDQVQNYLSELSDIQNKLTQAKKQPGSIDPKEVAGLESRIKEIQISMSNTVEESAREVKEVKFGGSAHHFLATFVPELTVHLLCGACRQLRTPVHS